MDFTSSARAAEDRTTWKEIVVKSSVVPQRCIAIGWLVGWLVLGLTAL